MFAQNMIDLKNKGYINSDVLTAVSDNCVQDLHRQSRHAEQRNVGVIQFIGSQSR